MITREVLPPRPSRRAVVALIALVAATGAVLCANFVAGERRRAADRALDLKLTTLSAESGAYASDGYNTGITRSDSVGVINGALNHEIHWLGESAPSLVMSVGFAFTGLGVSFATNVDYPQRHEHHDVVACLGGNPLGDDLLGGRCVYFDESRTP